MGANGPSRAQDTDEANAPQYTEAQKAWMTRKSDFFGLPEAFKEQLTADISKRFGNCHAFVASRAQPLNLVEGKFLDPVFPPERSSLIRFWNQADIVSQVEWERFTWVRLSDLFKDNRMEIFDDIQPDDIMQGNLGDCYFLSALSAIAEVPERIKRLFITTTLPTDCCYRVWILNLGMWTEFCIDDYYPIKPPPDPKKLGAGQKLNAGQNRDNPIAFSGPRINKGLVELWVLLLEKAWAKKYQCYYDIQAGYTDEVLTDLTGAPCETLSCKSGSLWDKIVQADQAKYILTAGCVGSPQSDDSELYQSLGLLIDHSYALISAKEVQIDAGATARLLKIRNPWGHFEWKGDWSDNSSKWTSETMQEVGYVANADDGTFWMSFEDFQRYFESCTICHVHDSYWTVALAMDQTKDEEFSVVELTATCPTTLYFMVCQIDERRFGGIEAGYQYAPVRLITAKLNPDNSLDYITGKMSAFSREAWLQVTVEPGTYLFYIEMNWRSEVTDLFGVSVYAQHEVRIRDATAENGDYLQRCYGVGFVGKNAPFTESESEQYSFTNYKLVGERENGDMREGIYVDLYTSKEEQQNVVLAIRHEPWSNMSLLKPYDKPNFELTLAPREQKIVIKKQVNLLSEHGFKVLVKKKLVPAV
jgi:calpain-15